MTLDIIVPARNCARGMEKLIATFRRAAERHAEVGFVFVDDASEDDTAEVLARVARETGGRIRLVRNERCLCIGGARNAGVAASEADYVAFADADDDYAPGAIGTMLAALKDSPDIAIYGFRSCRRDGERTWLPKRDAWELSPVGAWIKAVKRSVFVPFPENVFCEDCAWWFEQADRVDETKVVTIDQALYVHDRRDGGFSDAMEYLGETSFTLEALAQDNVLLKKGMNDRAASDVLRCLADMYDLRNRISKPKVVAAWRMRFAGIYTNVMTGHWVY